MTVWPNWKPTATVARLAANMPLFIVTHTTPPVGRETRARARQYAVIGDSPEGAIDAVRSEESEANDADPFAPRRVEAGTWRASESGRGHFLYNIYLTDKR